MSVLVFRRSSTLGPALLSMVCASVYASFAFGCRSSNTAADSPPPLPGPSLKHEARPLAQRGSEEAANPREVVLSQAVAMLLNKQHLSKQAIDDDLSRKSYKHFLETIDPDKLFFLQEDIDKLKKSELLFDDELLSGNLHIAHQANKIFLARIKQVQQATSSYLSKSIDLSSEEFRETDSDKVSYAGTSEQLAARWGRVLKLEILGRLSRMASLSKSLKKAISQEKKKERGSKPSPEEAAAKAKKLASLEKSLSKIPQKDSDRIQKAQNDLKKSYSARFIRLADVDALRPASNFINAITGSFDPHTTYMPPQDKENFDISMSGSLEGIGAVLMEDDHFIRVNDVVIGGASWRQGELEAGDLILSVTQEGQETVDIGDMKINKVVKMIRGPKGTTVSLTIEKDDTSIKTISIVRDKVSIKESYARGAIIQNKGEADLGYIYLPSFYGQTRGRPDADARFSANDIKKLLKIFEHRKLAGLVIDLRSNGGGLLDDARKMTGYFVKVGPVVQTQLPDGTIEVLRDTDARIEFTGDVVVLIDRFSASASEILAAALQDYKRAVIVGPGPTHGKGTVQGLLNLDRANTSPDDPPLGALKLTVQQFFRINGSSTQRRGVTADVPFPDRFSHLKSREADLDNALPWRRVDAQAFDTWPKVTWSNAELLRKSLARQGKSKYFRTLKQRGVLMDKRREASRIPLKRADYNARLKEQRDELDALSPVEDKLPTLFHVEPIEYSKRAAAESAKERKAEKKKQKTWSESLERDAAVKESLLVLRDMLAS